MASSTIRVWLPGPDSVALMGGLPAGMTADVWTGGEQLPDSAIVRDQLARYAAGEPLLNVVGERGY